MKDSLVLIDGNHLAHRIKYSSKKAFSRAEDEVFHPDAWSFMYIKSILFNAELFSPWEDFVICIDDARYWRKDLYPEYKGKRKREQNDYEDLFHATYKSTIEVIQNCLPFTTLKVKGAEADDIIGVLSKRNHEGTVIVSSDKDMRQCLDYGDTRIYDPIKKQFITSDHPELDLFTHICAGDSGDNIKPIGGIGVKTAPKVFLGEKDLTDEQQARFEENEVLVDFNKIPDRIRGRIIRKFKKTLITNKTFDEENFYQYLIDRDMNSLLKKFSSLSRDMKRYSK